MCSARTQAVRNGGTKTKKRRIEEDGETDDGIDAVEEPSYIVSIERDLRMDQQEWKATYFRDPPLEQVEKIPEFVSASKRSDAHGCIKVLRVAFEHYKEAGAYSSVVDQLQRDMHWVQRVEAQLGRSLGVRYHPTHLFVGQWSYDLDQVVSRLEGACEQDGVDLDYMRNDVYVVGGRRQEPRFKYGDFNVWKVLDDPVEASLQRRLDEAMACAYLAIAAVRDELRAMALAISSVAQLEDCNQQRAAMGWARVKFSFEPYTAEHTGGGGSK